MKYTILTDVFPNLKDCKKSFRYLIKITEKFIEYLFFFTQRYLYRLCCIHVFNHKCKQCE